jgi:hypothetical protein
MPDQSTQGYKDLDNEFSIGFDGDDEWGSVLSFWFAVAEVAYHAGAEIPARWKFQDSPVHGRDWEPEDYPASIVQEMYDAGEISNDDLIAFGNKLTRDAHKLKRAGKDY